VSAPELVPGRIYWIAGMGVMKFVEPTGKTLLFKGPSGGSYWADAAQVTSEASPEDVKTYLRNCIERNVYPKGFKPAW